MIETRYLSRRHLRALISGRLRLTRKLDCMYYSLKYFLRGCFWSTFLSSIQVLAFSRSHISRAFPDRSSNGSMGSPLTEYIFNVLPYGTGPIVLLQQNSDFSNSRVSTIDGVHREIRNFDGGYLVCPQVVLKMKLEVLTREGKLLCVTTFDLQLLHISRGSTISLDTAILKSVSSKLCERDPKYKVSDKSRRLSDNLVRAFLSDFGTVQWNI